MIGTSSPGSASVAGFATTALKRPSSTYVNEWRTNIQKLLDGSPRLEFFQIETANNGTLRYVDFADPAAGGTTADLTPFNGSDWNARKIQRGALTYGFDNGPTYAINIEDPDGALLAIVRDEAEQSRWGIAGSRVTIWSIPFSLLEEPSRAIVAKFIIRSAVVGADPAGVQFTIGAPDFIDMRLPRHTYNRGHCIQDYHRRFELPNGCRYPSDDFEQSTRQTFGGTLIGNRPATPTERGYGWWTSNADNVTQWETGEEEVKTAIASSGSYPGQVTQRFRCRMYSLGVIRFLDAYQDAPMMWKLIDGDFDVRTDIPQTGTKDDGYFYGLFVQDAADPTDWVAFGVAALESDGERRVRVRTTVSDVSTDDDSVLSDSPPQISPRGLRIQRVGDTIKVFSSATVNPTAWTELTAQETSISGLGDTVRVGLFAGSDKSTSAATQVRFQYFQFDAGGLPTCSLDEEACELRKNTHQFAAHPNIRRRG
jgi:hypothetical protein